MVHSVLNRPPIRGSAPDAADDAHDQAPDQQDQKAAPAARDAAAHADAMALGAHVGAPGNKARPLKLVAKHAQRSGHGHEVGRRTDGHGLPPALLARKQGPGTREVPAPLKATAGGKVRRCHCFSSRRAGHGRHVMDAITRLIPKQVHGGIFVLRGATCQATKNRPACADRSVILAEGEGFEPS